MGRLEEALQAALSYLLFHKGEEFVTENVEYYREVLGHDGEPREVSIRCRQVCFYVTMPSRVLSNITNNTALKQLGNRGGRCRLRSGFSACCCIYWIPWKAHLPGPRSQGQA